MAETSDHRAGLQHDVFLEVLVNLADWLQLGVVAVRTALWGWDLYGLIDLFWLGALPGGMAGRSAPFLALGRRTLRGKGGRPPTPFELATVQGLNLGAQLLIFQFLLVELPMLLVQLLLELLELMFVIALQATRA